MKAAAQDPAFQDALLALCAAQVVRAATAAFQKATRVLRQSMALEAKLIRDTEQGDPLRALSGRGSRPAPC